MLSTGDFLNGPPLFSTKMKKGQRANKMLLYNFLALVGSMAFLILVLNWTGGGRVKNTLCDVFFLFVVYFFCEVTEWLPSKLESCSFLRFNTAVAIKIKQGFEVNFTIKAGAFFLHAFLKLSTARPLKNMRFFLLYFYKTRWQWDSFFGWKKRGQGNLVIWRWKNKKVFFFSNRYVT